MTDKAGRRVVQDDNVTIVYTRIPDAKHKEVQVSHKPDIPEKDGNRAAIAH